MAGGNRGVTRGPLELQQNNKHRNNMTTNRMKRIASLTLTTILYTAAALAVLKLCAWADEDQIIIRTNLNDYE